MKKLVSWTQTYGNERILNMKLLQYDTIGNYIRNKCDYIIFSFHNCPENIFNESSDILSNLYIHSKLILIKYDNISYLCCYQNIMKKVSELGCTDILQIQDDQHGINSRENLKNLSYIDNIIEIYKSNKNIKYLNIFSNEGLPKKKSCSL